MTELTRFRRALAALQRHYTQGASWRFDDRWRFTSYGRLRIKRGLFRILWCRHAASIAYYRRKSLHATTSPHQVYAIQSPAHYSSYTGSSAYMAAMPIICKHFSRRWCIFADDAYASSIWWIRLQLIYRRASIAKLRNVAYCRISRTYGRAFGVSMSAFENRARFIERYIHST